jgi:hypothetical protein
MMDAPPFTGKFTLDPVVLMIVTYTADSETNGVRAPLKTTVRVISLPRLTALYNLSMRDLVQTSKLLVNIVLLF